MTVPRYFARPDNRDNKGMAYSTGPKLNPHRAAEFINWCVTQTFLATGDRVSPPDSDGNGTYCRRANMLAGNQPEWFNRWVTEVKFTKAETKQITLWRLGVER